MSGRWRKSVFMNKKFYKSVLLLLAVVLLTSCVGKRNLPVEEGSPARQWKSDQAEFYNNRITVINRRGCDLYALYLSPSSENEWSENLIGEYALPNHGELDVDIPVSDDIRLWDIRLEDRDHELVEICEKDFSKLTQEEMVMELAIEGGEDIVYIYGKE